MSRIQKRSTGLAIKQALFELRHAVTATSITILLSFLFYFALPFAQHQGQTRDEDLGYKKIYQYTPRGAQLEYQLTKDASEKAMARIKNDLEILSRRFDRGDFTIISLPGIKSTTEYKKILPYFSAYTYQVQTKDKSAFLKIKARNNNTRAIQALHKYLRYLEKNWQF